MINLVNPIKRASSVGASLFNKNKGVEKPKRKEAERLAKKTGMEDNKDFINLLQMFFNQAYMVGQKEAMLTNTKKDKTYMLVIISLLLNGVIAFMLFNQFFM